MVKHSSPWRETAGLSDTGRKRTLNEDSLWIDSDQGLLLIADGMGGHEAGEIASREAITALRDFLSRHTLEDEDKTERHVDAAADNDQTWENLPNPLIQLIRSAVAYTNRHIYGLNRDRHYADGQGMGTTLVGLWLPPVLSSAVLFHVGDSRIYLFRSGHLIRLTRDHTMLQQWEDYGRIGAPPAQNIILQALGASREVNPDIVIQTLNPGDTFLLCSDGLTGMLTDPQIQMLLVQNQRKPLPHACQQFIDLANEQGGEDNISLILARY
jgi:PPM family protein phosphatase